LPQTKSYIQGTFTENDTEKRLPQGPVITSHSGVLAALWLEIFLKRPDEFKINELDFIRKLFLPSECPFFAGFGNRPTDSRSYCAVGTFGQPTAALSTS
jgi:phosphatidate phosphatase LPIN